MCITYLLCLFLKQIMNDKNIVCKNHSARIDKEIARITPSNLNKRDLEDLYYKLLFDNKTLKCTVNNQNDKLKVLTTKLLRVSRSYSKDNKYNTNITIEELNEVINDLKDRNAKLTEKVRQLNMKLCSTKQFLKKTSAKCLRCMLHRKTSTSNLVSKRSDTVLQLAVSTQYETDKLDSTRTNDTAEYSAAFETPSEKRDDIQRENEERQLTLEQAIENAVNKHLDEKENLEKSIKQLNDEILKLKAVCRTYQDKESEQRISAKIMEGKLTEIEEENCNLKTELTIEKKKYCELELSIKSSENTSKLVKIIEDSLSSELQKKPLQLKNVICPDCKKVYCLLNDEIKSKVQDISDSQVNFSTIECSTPRKDDSGYAEGNKIERENYKSMYKLNEELSLKILKLESELNLQKAQNAEQATELLKLMTKELPKHNEASVKTLSCDGDTSYPISDKTKVDEVSVKSDNKSARSKSSDRGISDRNKESFDDLTFNREKTEHKQIAKKEITKPKQIKVIKEVTNFVPNLHYSIKNRDMGQFTLKNSEELHDIVNVKIVQSMRHDSVPHAYKVHNPRKSPDNTDYEISSISNEGPVVKNSSLSAGEDPGVYTYTSYSTYDTTSSDNCCLSDGELPLRRGKNLSIGERYMRSNNTLGGRHFGVKELTADSLEAVKREILRCRYLLSMDRPDEVI